MSKHFRYYKRDGTPYPNVLAWARDFENTKVSRRVAYTTLRDNTKISTVFLGINYNFGEGKPLIFETMVFPKDICLYDDMERYTTEAEAKAGHKKMVKKWEQKLQRKLQQKLNRG